MCKQNKQTKEADFCDGKHLPVGNLCGHIIICFILSGKARGYHLSPRAPQKPPDFHLSVVLPPLVSSLSQLVKTSYMRLYISIFPLPPNLVLLSMLLGFLLILGFTRPVCHGFCFLLQTPLNLSVLSFTCLLSVPQTFCSLCTYFPFNLECSPAK